MGAQDQTVGMTGQRRAVVEDKVRCQDRKRKGGGSRGGVTGAGGPEFLTLYSRLGAVGVQRGGLEPRRSPRITRPVGRVPLAGEGEANRAAEADSAARSPASPGSFCGHRAGQRGSGPPRSMGPIVCEGRGADADLWKMSKTLRNMSPTR